MSRMTCASSVMTKMYSASTASDVYPKVTAAFSMPKHPKAEGVPEASVTFPPSQAGGSHVSPMISIELNANA